MDLELKTIILPLLQGNVKRVQMNSNNNKLVWEVVLHCYFYLKYDESVSQFVKLEFSVCNYAIIPVIFVWCNQFFKIFHNVIGKTSLYKLPHRHMFYVKLFFVVFFSKYHLKLTFVFSKTLLQFICSIKQLGFLLLKIEIKKINKKFS